MTMISTRKTILSLMIMSVSVLTVWLWPKTASAQNQIGKASWYSTEACKYNPHPACPTADGSSLYDLEASGALFAASNFYPLGTQLRVTSTRTGASVIVTVRDRGGFAKYGRVIDLGKDAFRAISDLKMGVIDVEIEKL